MMAMRNAAVAAVLTGALLGSVASAAADNPVIATKWRITGETQIECMGHADEAIRRAGFEIAEAGSQSINGRRGNYTASVRCATEQRVVFFVVAGPSAGEANRLLDTIYNVF